MTDNRINNKRTLSLHCIYKLMNTIATHKLSPQIEMLVAGAISQELATINRRKHEHRVTSAS